MPNGTYFPYLGTDSSYNYFIHINGIGDAYQITGTSTSNLTHKLLGQTILDGDIEGTNCDATFDGDMTSSSARFRTNYLSSRCYLTNPSGTDNAVSLAGSFLAYHDNGTELVLNCPNSTYSNSLSSNMAFMFNGKSKIKFFGSEGKAQQFLQDNGSTPYFQTGRTPTFPTNMGLGWSSVSVPIGNAFYQGGANTNDGEGFWFCQNGQTTAFSSTADLKSMRWYDEDSITTGWYIEKAGIYWTIKKSILEILLQIDIGNIDIVDSRILSFRRNYFKHLKEIKQERVITYLKLVETYYKNPEIVTSDAFHKKVEDSFDWIERKKEDIFIMSFFAWLKAKMTKQDVYLVTLDLINS